MQQPRQAIDWFTGLPDDVVNRVLFFMPAREVVQTSLLARIWRHRWKSMPALRIHLGYPWSKLKKKNMAKFVDNLLLRFGDGRQGPLELCEFLIYGSSFLAAEPIKLWIQKAMSYKPQILIVDDKQGMSYQICIMPLITSGGMNLSRLELHFVDLQDKLLDFSRCPKLKNMLLRLCFLGQTEYISSISLEHLTIMHCTFPSDTRCTRISGQSLITLELSENYGNTPLLESMPSLVNASVILHDCEDKCRQEEYDILCSNNGCTKCGANVVGGMDYVLLPGISKATTLQLVAQPGVFLLERDLMCCPTFSNLKMLLLNEWCVVSDLHPLVCFLQHAPVLEKLTLQLGQMPVNWVETSGSYNPQQQPFPYDKFKVAEICYEEFDKRVEAICRILEECGIKHFLKTKRPSELIEVMECVQTRYRYMAAQNKLAELCYCSQCVFKGSPLMLLHHFADKSGLHSWPVQKINYSTSYPFIGPADKEHRRLLVAEEDSSVFLLAVEKYQLCSLVNLVCISGDDDKGPAYMCLLSASRLGRVAQRQRMNVLNCLVPGELNLGENIKNMDMMVFGGCFLNRSSKEIRLQFSVLPFPRE